MTDTDQPQPPAAAPGEEGDERSADCACCAQRWRASLIGADGLCHGCRSGSLIRERDEARAARDALRAALYWASVRLGICLGRMRACHEETGKHELLDEVEMFVAEARAALAAQPPAPAAAPPQLCKWCTNPVNPWPDDVCARCLENMASQAVRLAPAVETAATTFTSVEHTTSITPPATAEGDGEHE